MARTIHFNIFTRTLLSARAITCVLLKSLWSWFSKPNTKYNLLMNSTKSKNSVHYAFPFSKEPLGQLF